MVDLKIFLISADRCDRKVIEKLSIEEKQKICCYAVNAAIPKLISAKIPVINEWQLPWHSSRYQTLQYYEYGIIPHLIKNPQLIQGLTHIGMLHNDVLFAENSVNDMVAKLESNPNKIFYVIIRKNNQLFFTKDQLKHIVDYMSPKLNVNINANDVWDGQWISESMVVVPKDVFVNFGEFLLKYQYDLEDILNKNRWGLMDTVKHRLCGLTERLWGIYLVSCGMPIEKMNVIHDREGYEHKHIDRKTNNLL
jgi:hypothetical protein